jgi:hypothetical protein
MSQWYQRKTVVQLAARKKHLGLSVRKVNGMGVVHEVTQLNGEEVEVEEVVEVEPRMGIPSVRDEAVREEVQKELGNHECEGAGRIAHGAHVGEDGRGKGKGLGAGKSPEVGDVGHC